MSAAVTAAVSLGPRQAAVLAHLEEHPGLTAGELARIFGLANSLYQVLYRLERKAAVVAVTAWEPAQGRRVSRWHIAPLGTVPAPAPPADPEAVRRIRERDRLSQRARRARARGLVIAPGMEPPSLRDLPAAAADLPAAACRTADPDLFFPPDLPEAERQRDRQARVTKAKAICVACPVRTECYAAAVANSEPWGIWAGVDFADRTTTMSNHTRGLP